MKIIGEPPLVPKITPNKVPLSPSPLMSSKTGMMVYPCGKNTVATRMPTTMRLPGKR